MSMDLLTRIGSLADRLRTVEKQTYPQSTTNVGSGLFEDKRGSQGLKEVTIESTSDPSSGLSIADAGTEWFNPNTSVYQWWDGMAWHSGERVYENNGDLTAFTQRPLFNARVFFDVKDQTSAPATNGQGDVWADSTVPATIKVYNGSSFITISDAESVAIIRDAQAAYAYQGTVFRVFCQPTEPTAIDDGDRWVDTDPNGHWRIRVSQGVRWAPVPEPDDLAEDITITASKFQTSEFGQRMEMTADSAGGIIRYWTGVTGAAFESAHGYINPGSDTPITITYPALIIASPASSGVGLGRTSIIVSPQGTTISNAFRVNGASVLDNTVTINSGGLDVTGSSVMRNLLTMSTADITITGANQSVNLSNPPTTTNAANARINSSGAGDIRLVTSLAMYKFQQEPLTLETCLDVLKLSPTTWFDSNEVEENGDTSYGLHRVPGLLAEDVEKHVPGLALYDYDDALMAVAYDRVAAYLIPIIRDQQERIEALETRVGTSE